MTLCKVTLQAERPSRDLLHTRSTDLQTSFFFLPKLTLINSREERNWMKERTLETLLGCAFWQDSTSTLLRSNINTRRQKKKAKTETAVGLNEAEKWTFVLKEVGLCLRLLAPSVIFAPLSFAATTNGNTPVHISVCCLLEAFCNWSAVLNPLILMEMWVFSTFNLVKLLAKVDHHPNKAILDALDTPGMLCIKRNLWPQENRYKVRNCFLFSFYIFCSDLENVTFE